MLRNTEFAKNIKRIKKLFGKYMIREKEFRNEDEKQMKDVGKNRQRHIIHT